MKKHPFGHAIFDNPEFMEDIAQRKRGSLTFVHKTDPYRRATILASSVVAYHDKNTGNMELVDLDIDINKNNFVGTTTHDHDVYFKKTSRGVLAVYGYGSNKYYGYELPDDASDVPVEVDGHCVLYRGIYPDVDLRFENTRLGINKYFILHSPEANRPFVIKIHASKVQIDWDAENLRFYVIDKASGELLWKSRRISVWDNSVAGLECVNGKDMFVDFQHISSGVCQLTITVTEEYLSRAAFPVTVDPTATLYSTYDMAYQSSYSSSEYPTGVSGQTGTYKGRWCVQCSPLPSNATSVNNARFSAYENYDAGYGGNTEIRHVTSWSNWGPGWANVPNGYTGYLYQYNMASVGWWDFYNLGSYIWGRIQSSDWQPVWQIDSLDYESGGSVNYAWRKWDPDGSAREPYLYVDYNTNTPPNTPSITYPVTGQTVYDKRPRVAVTVPTDPQGNTQIIDASLDNFASYWNTASYPQCYSQTGSGGYLPQGTAVIFKFPNDLAPGTYTLYIRTWDGQAHSPTATVTFTVANPAWTDATIMAGVTLIKKTHMDELRSRINNVRAAYGLAAFNYTDPTITVQSTTVKTVHFSEARTAISEIRNVLNNYDSSNTTLDVSSSWVSTLAAQNIVYTDVLNELRNALLSI